MNEIINKYIHTHTHTKTLKGEEQKMVQGPWVPIDDMIFTSLGLILPHITSYFQPSKAEPQKYQWEQTSNP